MSIYFTSAINGAGFRERYRINSESYAANKRETKAVELNDNVARKIRLDTGAKPGTVKIYSLRLDSYFGPDIVLDHEDIYRNFAANDSIASFSLEADHVLLRSISNDPYLTLHSELILENRFLEYGVPFIFAGLCFIVFTHASFGSIPAFVDINDKRPSTGVNFSSLDGIRGLAALLVLGQHTGVLGGSGLFGVWLFFCLSGFLLAIPFVHEPARALDRQYMSSYIMRRIKRITPMYYVMITVTILLLGNFATAIRHYLFLQADGHYWTIAQEMLFYLLLPLVMSGSFILFRNKTVLSACFFLLLALLASLSLTTETIPLYGNNVTLRPMVEIFLIGIAVSFFYQWLKSNFAEVLEQAAWRRFCGTAGLIVLVGSILMCSISIPGLRPLAVTKYPGWYGLAAGLVILLTLLADKSFFNRIMACLPLRSIGIVGYSFYLLHPAIIVVVRGTSRYFADYYPVGITLFLLAGIATYTISVFTYSCIERPFIRK